MQLRGKIRTYKLKKALKFGLFKLILPTEHVKLIPTGVIRRCLYHPPNA